MIWAVVIGAYLFIGLFCLLSKTVRNSLAEELADVNNAGHPAWKVGLFLILVCSAALLLWPVFLKDWYGKKKSLWKGLQSNPVFREQAEIFGAMAAIVRDGCDTDELPGAFGEFGCVPSNPIPTHTVYGSMAYLSALRASDGTNVHYERIGSLESDVSPHPVDAYVIRNEGGKEIATLYLSPYQKVNSGKAPKGFRTGSVSTGQGEQKLNLPDCLIMV